MKFMYHSASFGVFLFLLILASGDVNTSSYDKATRRQQRGPPPSILEGVIVMYVFGTYYLEMGKTSMVTYFNLLHVPSIHLIVIINYILYCKKDGTDI